MYYVCMGLNTYNCHSVVQVCDARAIFKIWDQKLGSYSGPYTT